MAIPVTRSICLPLLRVINDAGGELSVQEATARVERYFPELTQEDKLRRYAKTGAAVWPNRIRWARKQLVDEGFLYPEPVGVWRITPRGRDHLEENWAMWQPRYSQDDDNPEAISLTPGEDPTGNTALPSEVQESSPPPEIPPLNLHQRLQNWLHQLGDMLGYYPETEFREPPYIYDVVWKTFAGAQRAACVFEVQHRGNLIEALAKLQHAKDAWGSRLFLIVTEERDRRRVDRLVAPLLSGTFHRLARDLVVLTPDRVEDLYQSLNRNRDLLKKLLVD